MKKIIFAAFSCAMLLITSCSKTNNNSDLLVFSHNAEFDSTWINEKFLQEFSKAHSGNRVSVTDSIMPFSLGFHKTLSSISSKKIKSVTISAWVYVDADQTIKDLSLVASIDDKTKNIFWFSAPVKDKVKENRKWFFVSEEIPLNKNIDQQPNYTFTGYVLNNSKIKVLVDDISFRFTEE